MTIKNSTADEVVAVIREAGKTVSKYFHDDERPDLAFKSGIADFVTQVDKSTELFLMGKLSEIIPGSGFLAEETASTNSDVLKTHEYVWIIDPIDGTTNFVHKIPFCAISVALYHNNSPVLGIVYNPILDELFFADQGGAYKNSESIRVSRCDNLSQALFCTGIVHSGNRKHEQAFYDILRDLTVTSRGFRRLGSAALDLCYVAAGAMDFFYEKGINSWDFAAGAFLVQQAGGKVTDFKGSDEFLLKQQVLASGSLHEEILSIIKPLA